MSTSLKIILRVTAALVLIALVIAWQADVFTEKIRSGATDRQAANLDGRQTVLVESLSLPQTRNLLGALRSRNQVHIAPRLTGRVNDLLIEAGDSVRAGDVLVRLDEDELEAAVAQAGAAADAARARLRGAEKTFARIEAGFKDDVASEIRLIEARQVRDAAQASSDQAQEALRQARIQASYATIRSPITGIVIDTLLEEGDLALPGQPMVIMFDPDRIEAEISVPSSLASHFKVRAEFALYIEAIGVRTTGTVRTLVPRADTATRSVLARLELDAPQGSLPGMFVRLELHAEERPVLALPAYAIGSVRQLDFVWFVAEDDTLRRRFVRPGRFLGDDRVEILSGLTEGDRVLARWSHNTVDFGASTDDRDHTKSDIP